jgi:diguanylate cyclase (GGDEF)-like protein/PAS domain S-box-containing protein
MSIITRLAYSLGIKQRLILLVLLAVAPLVTLIVWDAAARRSKAIEEAGAAAQQSALVAALRQSGALNEAITLTESMRSIPSISLAGGDACHTQVARLQQLHPRLNSIGVLNREGTVVCHNLLQSPQAVGHQKLLKEALRDGAPDLYVSHYLHGPITGRPVIFVARPLLSATGAKVGLVYVSLDLEAFSELADQIMGGAGRALMVVEPDTGIVLARSARSRLKLGSIFPDANVLRAMRANPQGGHTEGVSNGTREIFGYAPLPGAETSGAMVAVGVPRDVVLAGLNRQSLVGFVFALAAIGLALCSAWALAYYSQVRPAKQLSTVAERIGQGDLTARADLESWQAPEFRRLGETLNCMAGELEHANLQLKASEGRYRLLAENTADLVTQIDPDGCRVYVSPASRSLLGYAPEELIGKKPIDLAHPLDLPQLKAMLDKLQRSEEATAVQYRARRRDGSNLWVETNGRSLGAGKGVMLSIRDVTRRKLAEDRLEEANRNLLTLASTDSLTGLDNRRSFDRALAREQARCAREGLPLSLLLIDVDHFKNFNDTFGHQDGDECLRKLSQLLKSTARRPADVTARYGGEELAVILPNTNAEGARHFAEQYRKAVQELKLPNPGSAYGAVTVSIGLDCETTSAWPESSALQHADEALYRAKANGRNRIETFDAATYTSPARRYGA